MEITAQILAAREKWRYRGQRRPSFALDPGVGQESVWDFPRPPRMQTDTRRISVTHGDRVVAESTRAVRVLETSAPPTFYIPPEDVDWTLLTPSATRTLCEWKGIAQGFDLDCAPEEVTEAAWVYVDTFAEFAPIEGFFAFYPAKLRCTVDDEVVRPQPGGYYGGWITSEVIGPFKGEPGSQAWW